MERIEQFELISGINPTGIAVYSRDYGAVTYAKLNENQNEFLSFISCEIDRPLIMIRCRISYETIVGYTAALKAGIPLIMCDERNGDPVVKMYKPHYIWQHKDIDEPEGYVISGRLYDYRLYRKAKMHKLLINSKLALLLATSGSTGSCKYVRISYDNIVYNTKSIIKALEIKNTDKAGVMLPLSYTYGLSVVNTYLYVGASLIICDESIGSNDTWNYFERCGGNVICGVPDTYELLYLMNIWRRPGLHLKLATQAGGRLNPDTEENILKLAYEQGFDFAVMYGQTEATARMTCHFLNRNPEHIHSVGKPVAGGNISILDGEVIYSGPNVSLGYAEGLEDLALGDENKGILHTGDIGKIDKDGFLYITGRIKRIAKAGGKRINHDELEAIIEHNSGMRTACIEKDCCICIMVISGDSSILDGIQNEVISLLNVNRRFVRTYSIRKLPVNTHGKRDYNELAAMLT